MSDTIDGIGEAAGPYFVQRQSSLFDAPGEPALGRDGVYDEIVTGTGRIRPHWQGLIGRLAPHDRARMASRRDEAHGLLRQNGVTYTIYGDPEGGERVWPLDIVPLVISAEEWRAIEAGVIQRARLLNAVLADLYGPQRMIGTGRLPPILLEADPSFLRPCFDIRPKGGIHLHLYAVDLARAPDGRWWVLADRTEAPSGAGYALENRSVIGRVLGDCLAHMPARPLTPFFSALRDGLAALAPDSAGDGPHRPRIVLLTPGSYNETYFEHVYLARHLGITLVEGADLTVRDRRVFLKTVSALEPVDVILRRLDDDFCDPLELRADSALGVAGLTEAARAGNVTVANALGSGVLQAMAFKPFLPPLCRALLGEEIQLPDVASWWCGGRSELDYVLAHLDQLVIKPAFPALGMEPVFGAELSQIERSELAARIAARPLDFVGQERVALSHAPIWDGEGLQPRPMVLRVFVAAGPDGFVVMPGGLTRVSPETTRPIVSMQRGGGSKDTWVLGATAEQAAGEARSPMPVERANVIPLSDAPARRSPTNELPSRAADGLFWVGRYAERTDGVVRLLRALLMGLTDTARPWSGRDAEPLCNLANWIRLLPALDLPVAPAPLLIPLIQSALADPQHPTGVAASLQNLLRSAAGVRDHVPPDCWRAVMALGRHAPISGSRLTTVQLLLRLEEFVTLNSALWGTIEDSIPRDAGWRFLDIGKRLERAIHLMAIVRGAPGPASGGASHRVEEARLINAILTLTGVRVPTGLRPDWMPDRAAVLNAALAQKGDPRGLRFQLAALADHLAALPQPTEVGPAGQGMVASAREIVEQARALVQDSIARAVHSTGHLRHAAETPDPMRDAFARLDGLLAEVSSLLAQAYFAHAFARPA
ncbi:MAG TPA: circularly permuted type 2 ATP-grasp protein [Alphaproteobacteria bacterium]|nr:circularly permuted type 2 ATP-grasp protein [Alphaproteobacteria bacterium]